MSTELKIDFLRILKGKFVMISAYILVNSRTGSEDEVYRAITTIENIKEGFKVFGAYDIIVRVEEKDSNSLQEFITRKIRQIENVISTLTLIIL